MEKILSSNISLGEIFPNIGSLFLRNREKYKDLNAFAERIDGPYKYYDWGELTDDMAKFSGYLIKAGLSHGDRIALVSKNSYLRFIAEMTIFSLGMVSVPIFKGYTLKKIKKLIDFSEVKMIISEDEDSFDELIESLDPDFSLSFKELQKILDGPKVLSDEKDIIFKKMDQVKQDDLALIMFTSGTTSFPKGVMLSHKNILSQQKSLQMLWNLKEGRRFLCYLPWHHSFGGLFERFLAIYNAGCLAIDDSMGKEIDRLFENFNEIRPHLYFSVPQVYQKIASEVLTSNEAKKIFFHDALKFVFTAAAPLPLSSSKVFQENGIPVIEGWGLTETSPCCTLTDQTLDRKIGVVGTPLPGVQIKLSEEDELLIKGPNVMQGYFKNESNNKKVFDKDGWFKTGDIGSFTPEGVKILSRKDRIFKLANAEKVYPVGIEEKVRTKCNFIRFIYIFGSGESNPMALIFPNYVLLNANKGPFNTGECELPSDASGLKNCLFKCLHDTNEIINLKYEKIKKAIVINRELTIENGELTPTMKLIPRIVEKNYRPYMECLIHGNTKNIPNDGYMIDLN